MSARCAAEGGKGGGGGEKWGGQLTPGGTTHAPHASMDMESLEKLSLLFLIGMGTVSSNGGYIIRS